MKTIHKYTWVFVIIILMAAGIGAGLLSLLLSDARPVVDNVRVGDTLIRNMPIEEAGLIINDYYEDLNKNGALKIEVDEIPFTIPYSDIDVDFDIEKTMEYLVDKLPKNEMEQYFRGTSKENNLRPFYTYNSGKLVRRCEELFSHYEIEPVSESYKIEDGELKIYPSSPGLDIDYKLLVQELGNWILIRDEILKINTQNSPIFAKVFKDSIYDKTFDTIANKSTVEYDSSLREKLERILASFDNVLFESDHEIKLSSLVPFSQMDNDVERDLLNRLASTLYQATLPLDGIKVLNRKPAERPVPYARAGLEVVIEGEEADLVLKNETGSDLLILAELSDKEFKLYIISPGPVKTGTIEVEERDYVPPSVITIVNESLSPNTTRVVSEGVPGFTASVTRIMDGISENISQDKYLPVSKTIETGKKPAHPAGSK